MYASLCAGVKVTGKRSVSARYCVGGLYWPTAKSSDRNFSRQLLSWTNPLQFVVTLNSYYTV